MRLVATCLQAVSVGFRVAPNPGPFRVVTGTIGGDRPEKLVNKGALPEEAQYRLRWIRNIHSRQYRTRLLPKGSFYSILIDRGTPGWNNVAVSSASRPTTRAFQCDMIHNWPQASALLRCGTQVGRCNLGVFG